MKSILIIGLGRFGRHIINDLQGTDVEVMAVDRDEGRVIAVADKVESAQIGNATNESFLNTLGVSDFDCCIVAIGDDFLSSLEVTSLLKELGAKKVIARAARDTQMKFLLRNGADEVVYPEKQLAQWMALHVSSDNIFDYFEISHEYGVFEISTPTSWIGKTIRELDTRRRYRINIIAIKIGQTTRMVDDIEQRLGGNERILVVGKKADIEKCINEKGKRSYVF
ncbi:MAG: NAD-binding protein [bacterium]